MKQNDLSLTGAALATICLAGQTTLDTFVLEAQKRLKDLFQIVQTAEDVSLGDYSSGGLLRPLEDIEFVFDPSNPGQSKEVSRLKYDPADPYVAMVLNACLETPDSMIYNEALEFIDRYHIRTMAPHIREFTKRFEGCPEQSYTNPLPYARKVLADLERAA